MAEALVVRHLSKRFGGLRAVQDLSFSVAENETVALIGPNGAGKTTSFNLITVFHRPDSGSVSAFGREIVGLRPTQKTVCTGVEMFRKLLDEGRAGDNIGALLRGTKKEDV